MITTQMRQIKDLQQTVLDLKERVLETTDKLEIVESNATKLSERSTALVQASMALEPTITRAEYDYFQDIKRLQAKCSSLEAGFKAARSHREPTRSTADVQLDTETVQKVNVMLDDQSITLKMTGAKMKELEKSLRTML